MGWPWNLADDVPAKADDVPAKADKSKEWNNVRQDFMIIASTSTTTKKTINISNKNDVNRDDSSNKRQGNWKYYHDLSN